MSRSIIRKEQRETFKGPYFEVLQFLYTKILSFHFRRNTRHGLIIDEITKPGERGKKTVCSWNHQERDEEFQPNIKKENFLALSKWGRLICSDGDISYFLRVQNWSKTSE